MRIRPEHAYAVLSRVDPERLRLGWRVGLRDAALLALVAAGLSPDEIAGLSASAITMNGGQVFVTVPRGLPSRWLIVLDKPLVPPVLDWLEACRLWASTEHLFQHGRAPITAIGVRKVLLRYGSRRTPQRPGRRRRRWRVALYARTTAADHSRDITVDTLLAGLAAHATQKGWDIVLQCADTGPWPEGKREGLRRLTEAVRASSADTVQALLVHNLGHLARSLRHLTDLGRLLAARDIALIALDDRIDTTDPGGALRWRDWLDISARLTIHHRAETARLARLRHPGDTWGRPAAVINPQELLAWWEGRGGRRPLSLRALAARLGLSEATTRKHLHTLRAAGQVDDPARLRALATRGGTRRGGRPANPLDDTDLAAAWSQSPSVTAVARHLHVSRSRVRARLHHLGLEPRSKTHVD